MVREVVWTVNEKLISLDVGTERFKRKPLRIEVYDFLKSSIIQGKLKPGEKLNEVELGQHLGISRTPIRETLLRLENEGFVSIDPGRGAIVAKHSRKDLEEIYPIVAVLEGLAAALATPHLSRSDLAKMRKCNKQMKEASQASGYMELNILFHQTFLENCHNDRLLGLLLNFKDQIFRFRVFSLSMPNRLAESAAEHDSIVQAFEEKNAKLAEELVRAHVRMAKAAIEKASLDY